MRPFLLLLAALLPVACGRTVSQGAARTYDLRLRNGSRVSFPTWGDHTTLVARSTRTGSVRELEMPGLSADVIERILGETAEEEALELWCSGYRPLSLPVPVPQGPLVLQPGIPVRLRIESRAPLPSDGHELHLEFLWRGPGDLPEAPILHSFGGVAPEGWEATGPPGSREPIVITAEHPEAAVRVSFPGRYRVSWGLFAVTRSQGSYIARGIRSPDAGGNVVVAESGTEPQVLTLRIPELQLQQAFDSLGR